MIKQIECKGALDGNGNVIKWGSACAGWKDGSYRIELKLVLWTKITAKQIYNDNSNVQRTFIGQALNAWMGK